MNNKRIKTVVVGSGLAGLCAGYFCHLAGHEVTILEAKEQRGMDAHRLTFGSEKEAFVDVPLRVMSEDGWQTLLNLCDHLGVGTYAVDAPVSLGWLGKRTWFRSGSLRLGSYHLPTLGSLRFINKESIKIGRDLIRFYHEPLVEDQRPESIAQFFSHRSYHPIFWRGFLLPLLSTITTCRQEKLLSYPSVALLRMVRNMIFGPPLRRLCGGTKAIVDKLVAPVNLHSGSPVTSLEILDSLKMSADSPKTSENPPMVVKTARGDSLSAHYVIFATQANHLGFLKETFPEDLKILSEFEFDKGELVVHQDSRVMPKRRRDWTPLSYLMTPDFSSSMFSVWVNPIEPSLKNHDPIFQTWNPIMDLDPERVIRRMRLERAVVGLETAQQIRKLEKQMFTPNSRVFFCGAWAYPGVPLLESAVKSAVRVAKHLHISLPFAS